MERASARRQPSLRTEWLGSQPPERPGWNSAMRICSSLQLREQEAHGSPAQHRHPRLLRDVHRARALDLEQRLHQRKGARVEQPVSPEALDNSLEEVLPIDARGLEGEVGTVGHGQLDVGLSESGDVDLPSIGGDERDVREPTSEIADLQPL